MDVTQALPPIIVGVGLTNESEFVLQRVAELSGDVSRLVAVHAEQSTTWLGGMDGDAVAVIAKLQLEAQGQAQVRLESLCTKFNISKALVRDGSPAKVLHDAAREYGARVIAIGTHGYHGWRALLGETANSILHDTPCDVLAILTKDIATPNIRTIKKILVAIDLSDDSDQVLQRAMEIAQRHNAEVVLTTVLKPLDIAYPWMGATFVDGSLANLQHEADLQAQAALQKYAAAFEISTFEVRSGAVSREIHEAVAAYDADLVVMGSHGRHGLQLILGSTPNDVLHGLNCDLMAVRL